jgi:glycerol-3-phosphate dehydrogenase (NAD(P)+)
LSRIPVETLAVLGAGSWGTTLANLLAEKGQYTVRLWVREDELLKVMEEHHENSWFLQGVRLNENLSFTGSIEEAVNGAATIVVVIPSHGVRGVFSRIADHIPEGVAIVSASKGIEEDSLLTVSQVLKELLPEEHHRSIAVLSGPSFAKEVSLGLPTAVCTASETKDVAENIQQIFSTPSFRVYTNQDILGVELGGALKNVIALAAGTSDGLGLGANARAALITRGLAEITRLGEAMGALPQTFYGLSGLGDLVLTCTGELSRNRRVGFSIGKGRSLNEIVAEMNMVAEGVKTSRAVYRLARKYGVDMPITDKVNQVLYEGKPPKDAVMELMMRELKEE